MTAFTAWVLGAIFAGYTLFAIWQAVADREFRQRWGWDVAAAYVVGIAAVLAVVWALIVGAVWIAEGAVR